jgi:hypothetical protein
MYASIYIYIYSQTDRYESKSLHTYYIKELVTTVKVLQYRAAGLTVLHFGCKNLNQRLPKGWWAEGPEGGRAGELQPKHM